MAQDIILETKGLKKTFVAKKRKTKIIVEAVKGIDLEVRRGEIFGFLGPNGAGKTTSLSMLTTLLSPTGGEAKVVGYDLKTQMIDIRRHIGYVSQAGGSDTSMNARENLILQARLYGVSKEEAEKRSEVLIERFQITEFAARKAASYSGGQKRRLDLALGIIHKPDIVFLDEPTTGLDPQSRAYFWKEIQKINAEGMTIFLTTHYLEEADNLCSRLAIIDHGEIVAKGTNEELKKSIGLDSISIGMDDAKQIKKARELMQSYSYVEKQYTEDMKLILFVKEAEKRLLEVLQTMEQNKLPVNTIELAKPSLDDVFLQKTGRLLREGGEN